MDNLFRFVILRPPDDVNGRGAIALEPSANLLQQLQSARASNTPAASLKQVAQQYVKGPEFVADPASLQQSAALSQLDRELASAEPVDLGAAIRSAFDQDAATIVSQQRWQQDKLRLHGSLVALKLLPDSSVRVDPLLRFVRLVDLIDRAAQDDPALENWPGVTQALARPVGLPAALFPLPAPPEEQRSSEPPASDADQNRPALLKQAATLAHALNDLSGLPSDRFQASISRSSDEPAGRAAKVALQEPWETTVARIGFHLESGVSTISRRLTDAAIAALSDQTRRVLTNLQVDLRTADVTHATDRVRDELVRLAPQLIAAQAPVARPPNVAPMGGLVYPITSIPDTHGKGAFFLVHPFLPNTHGKIQPVGIADLLVVKYHLIRYERGEVAYIENVLKGEAFKRHVSRSETTEQTITQETATTTEEERDLQATDRFELDNETQNTIAMNGKLVSGFTISPSYGPVLQFQNNNQNPLSGAQTISERQASRYAREITSRSASRVTTSVRRQVIQRTLEKFKERTEHDFENRADGAGNIIGIYQWLDKVYQAQVFNYGQRLFYDVMVPEPAAFLIKAQASRFAEGRGLVKPDPFTLDASEVHDWNYAALAQSCGATNIEPPPPQYKTVSKTFAESDGSQFIAKSEELSFPGYRATGYRFAWRYLRPLSQTNPVAVGITVGVADAIANEVLQGETDSLSIGIAATNITHIVLSIDLFCERTDATYQAWQTKAHAAIQAAYAKRVAEYEDRVANLEASLRIQIIGQSSDQNRLTERTELKRSCISLITYQHYDVFRAIELGGLDPDTGQPLDLPQVRLNVAEAQGTYVRFFEQAFEWDQMVYQFYPYFWDRKEGWIARVAVRDPDSAFAEFLKAGWARVLVPVRPGFESALAHFMETSEIPTDADLGQLHSELYLPIIEEIKSKDGSLDDGVQYGDPWEVRLPTTLVMLRPDASLPKWKAVEDAKGRVEWVPDEA